VAVAFIENPALAVMRPFGFDKSNRYNKTEFVGVGFIRPEK
jgi:hypothetical protein